MAGVYSPPSQGRLRPRSSCPRNRAFPAVCWKVQRLMVTAVTMGVATKQRSRRWMGLGTQNPAMVRSVQLRQAGRLHVLWPGVLSYGGRATQTGVCEPCCEGPPSALRTTTKSWTKFDLEGTPGAQEQKNSFLDLFCFLFRSV